MGYILFKNKKKPVEAQAKKLNNNQIEITGCAVNTSGFSYYQDAEMKRKYGDYPDFTTLYRELDESYILSNNGSTYPDEPEPEPQPEPSLKDEVAVLKEAVSELQNDMQSINKVMGG